MCQAKRVAAVVDFFYAVEKPLVHHQLVVESGVAWQEVFGYFNQFGRGVGFGERHQHAHDTLKSRAEIVEWENCVGECRRFRIVDDRID